MVKRSKVMPPPPNLGFIIYGKSTNMYGGSLGRTHPCSTLGHHMGTLSERKLGWGRLSSNLRLLVGLRESLLFLLILIKVMSIKTSNKRKKESKGCRSEAKEQKWEEREEKDESKEAGEGWKPGRLEIDSIEVSWTA